MPALRSSFPAARKRAKIGSPTLSYISFGYFGAQTPVEFD